jgi:hypothetical protein
MPQLLLPSKAPRGPVSREFRSTHDSIYQSNGMELFLLNGTEPLLSPNAVPPYKNVQKGC